MEKSNVTSGMTESQNPTPLSGVGETSLATQQQPPQIPTTFTKVDNNLTGIGFFSASSKRSRKAIEKTTVLYDHGIERRISILPSAKYGLPITQDQDFWLALMKLVSDRLQLEGKITNPFTFTTAELTKILNQAHSGKNYKAVEEWLAVMVSTTVEGGAYNVARKAWIKDRTHAVDRVVSVGKELPNGSIADRNHIWFSQWQLDNINAGNLVPIELTIYNQLQNNIAKNLVPHLQEWLYASQGEGRFEKQYGDICQLLSIRAYQYRSDIERKLGPSLDELTAHGYISKWAVEPMADKKTYKLILWHGPKYHSDQQARLESKRRAKRIPESPATEIQGPRPTRSPRQRTLPLEPEVDATHLAALTSRGVTEPQARKALARLSAKYPLQETLEWADQQIAAQPTRFKNPPGFYISLLRDRTEPPPTFQSSAVKKAHQEAILRQQQEANREEERRMAEDMAAEDRLDRLNAEHPERYKALFEEARQTLYAEYPKLAHIGRQDDSIHEGAIRARIKQKLAALDQSSTALQETPPSVAETVSHNMMQEPRETNRLDEIPPVLRLQTILNTPQLSRGAIQQAEVFPIDEWV